MFVQVICQEKTARLPDCYCFLGVNIHDYRDSQPSSGWLRKMGVLDFLDFAVGSSPAIVVNNDVTSHRTNPLDPVFSSFWHMFRCQALPCLYK